MAGNSEKDIGKKTRNKTSLSNSLKSFVINSVLPMRQEQRKAHSALITRIVLPILNKVGELDDRFRSECVGLHDKDRALCVGVNRDDYYNVDIVVNLSNLLAAKCVSKQDDAAALPNPVHPSPVPAAFLDSGACDNPYIPPLPGFGYILADPLKSLVHDLLSIKQDEVSSAQQEDVNFAGRSFLSPGKVVKKFCSLVSESLEILREECFWEEEPTVYEISAKREGHAVLIHAVLRGEEFTVELIPALQLNDWPASVQSWGPEAAARPNQWLDYARMSKVKHKFFVYAQRPPAGHDAFRLWCTHFGLSQKLLASSVLEDDEDMQSSCRALVLLAMLGLCEENPEEFHPITPRIVTTAFLHQCTQYPLEEDWAPDKLGRAFVDLFMALVGMLKAGGCAHYFLPAANIMENSEDLRPVAHHLKAILGNIVENPNKTQFLHYRYSGPPERAGSNVSR